MSSAASKPKAKANRAVKNTLQFLAQFTIEACGGGSARCMMARFSCQKQKKDLQYWIEGLFGL
jgi:hypothetical protein